VDGRSSGAAQEACMDIMPQHGALSQPANTLPYTVNLSDFTADSYIGGQSYQSKNNLTGSYVCTTVM